MNRLFLFLIIAATSLAQTTGRPQLPATDAVRIREFYGLENKIEDKVWPGWSNAPNALLLITNNAEFLTHEAHPPNDFQRIDNDLYVRPRHFPVNLLATFPAFGTQSVIVIGEAENTAAKTSTPWLITLMHEHFHQWQDSQPDLYTKVNALGLARGDTSGMWMLNYPFPYDDAELGKSYDQLRGLLLAALQESDDKKFESAAHSYVAARGAFMAKLKADDRKYLSFQLWKEGVARYVQIKCAEEAARSYRASPEYMALKDYESFAAYGARARRETLEELKKTELSKSQRVVVYSFGAAEALLLDRLNPKWRDSYFQNLFTLDPHFER
jgi:hypothetical protein